MFQSFDEKTTPEQGTRRIPLLRARLREAGVDAFLVPRADEHQGEYVAARAERLQWLTGFTGSAGVALVMHEQAILFVDGRYTIQAAMQVDKTLFEIASLIETPPPAWLRENAEAGLRVGFDPWLHTIAEARALKAALAKVGGELVALDRNLVDAIWDDQPPAPASPVELHPAALAGEEAEAKLARLRAGLVASGASHAVLTDPSSLAWTFNLRGADVAHTPLALGFAILAAEGPALLYLAPDRVGDEARSSLAGHAELRTPDAFTTDLARLAGQGARVALDPALAAEKLRAVVIDNGGTVIETADPARLPRAVKNRAEIEGSRASHRRDGAAVTRFLHWLSTLEPEAGDEIAAARTLEEFRRRLGEETQSPLRDISFDTISGAGPNGAIIHYRVTERTSRRLGAGELYLVDSGGQYQDGTTDITRTVVIGTPTDEMRSRYTIVLKGLIAISLLRFPAGTRGCDIDAFARHAHWQAGIDYLHGTGHGVGSYLSVHEGPQRIARTGVEKLLAGMILSNEPGYYKAGHYGIRLENLILVTPARPVEGGEIDMHGFETLTLAPFERGLIDIGLLERREIEWLDAYHARVRREIGPMLDGEAARWLEAATEPL